MGTILGVARAVAAGAAVLLCAQALAIAQDRQQMNDAVRVVIPSLPLYGQSKEARDGFVWSSDALRSSFSGEGSAGSFGIPIGEPNTSGFKVSWSIEPTSLRATPEERRAAFANAQRPCGERNVVPDELGPDTCVGSSGEAGAQDVNFSGDPYMGSGTAFAVRACATVWVQVVLSSHPDASHGGRTRPEVIEAMKQLGQTHVRSAATTLINAIDAACSVLVPPIDDGPDDPQDPHDDRLAATVECGPTIVISQLPSLNCHIIFTGWIRNSSYPVIVEFPEAGPFYNHPNGIQIAQGAGQEYVNNWDGPPHSWGMFVFACPALQNTGANCYDAVTTPGEKTVRIVIRQKDQAIELMMVLNAVPHPNQQQDVPDPIIQGPLQANLNQVFVNGFYFATMDVGLQLGWDRTAIWNALHGARSAAVNSTALPTGGIDRVIAAMNGGISNEQLVQMIGALKANFAQQTNRMCQNNLNLYSIWVLGYYMSSVELAAQYGLDKTWMMQTLNELRNAAGSSGLPFDGVDQVIGYLNQGYSPQQTYAALLSIKNDYVQKTNYVYQCN